MPRYSAERKEAVLKKMLPPYNMTVTEVSREEGISEQTLYNWRKQAKQQGQVVPGSKPTPDHWSAETKFAVVMETAALSESELSQYCREKGLYPEQVHHWKAECMQGFQSSAQQQKTLKQQIKADRAKIKQLKRELREKEKALAETAALLVLRKKLHALWDHEDEES